MLSGSTTEVEGEANESGDEESLGMMSGIGFLSVFGVSLSGGRATIGKENLVAVVGVMGASDLASGVLLCSWVTGPDGEGSVEGGARLRRADAEASDEGARSSEPARAMSETLVGEVTAEGTSVVKKSCRTAASMLGSSCASAW